MGTRVGFPKYCENFRKISLTALSTILARPPVLMGAAEFIVKYIPVRLMTGDLLWPAPGAGRDWGTCKDV